LKTPPATLILPALLVAALDQTTKLLVAAGLPLNSGLPIIEGFLDLVHVRNRGMAFGMMHGFSSASAYILAGASILAVVFIILFAERLSQGSRFGLIGLSLILGGAVGNLIDRIRLGEVIDFVDVYVGRYHWPAFNVADAAITVGTLSLLLLYTRAGKKR
jgi:signal peptidase II